MRKFQRASVSGLIALSMTLAVPAGAKENVMLVLDASGSMWGQIDGRTKVEIAREAVDGIVSEWNHDNQIGLIAYGHRRKGDCADIETLVPLGPLDAASFLATVKALNAKGMTPLSQAVIDAAAALKSSEQKATVILISDGEETCNLDPCAVGAELEQAGVDFTAHVIGFDVSDLEHQAQLRCLAENTGGRYFNARDAAELSAAVQGAVSASTEPPPPPATATLKPLGMATITQPLSVGWTGPADKGDYITVVTPDAADNHYLTYGYVPEGEGDGAGEIKFAMPATAGEYELRYVSPSREKSVLLRLPITIHDAGARIEAPETASAGGMVDVVAEGPVSDRHWIGFVKKGAGTGAYMNGHYERPTAAHSEIKLRVPAESGEYELRYVLNENERVLASHPITVIESEAMVSGPAEVVAGIRVVIDARGPVHNAHWIGFAPAGSNPSAYVSGGYGRPQGETSKVTVVAPFEPGEYEYRYVLFEGDKVVASQPVTVVPAEATLQVPAEHPAQQVIEIGFSGPRNSDSWIGIVPVGGDGSNYEGWSYVPDEGETVTFNTPEKSGDWEVIFYHGRQVLARAPLRVTPKAD